MSNIEFGSQIESSHLDAYYATDGITYVTFNYGVKAHDLNSDAFDQRVIENGVFLMSNSLYLWENDLIVRILESLEAYMIYLGEGFLEKFINTNETVTFGRCDLIEEAIAKGIKDEDLWCLAAGLSDFSNNDFTVDEKLVEYLVSSRKPLIEYAHDQLTMGSPYSYLSPIFPAVLEEYEHDSFYLPLHVKEVAIFTNLLTDKAFSISEAEKSFSYDVTLDRQLNALESKALVNYINEVLSDNFEGKADNLNKKQFVEFYGRMVPYSSRLKSYDFINRYHIDRVLDEVELMDYDLCLLEQQGINSYASVFTHYEWSIYASSLKAHTRLENIVSGSDYLMSVFFAQPVNFMNNLFKTVEAESDYQEILLANGYNVTPRSLQYRLILALHTDFFNLRELFDECMSENNKVPFELLLNMKLEIDNLTDQR